MSDFRTSSLISNDSSNVRTSDHIMLLQGYQIDDSEIDNKMNRDVQSVQATPYIEPEGESIHTRRAFMTRRSQLFWTLAFCYWFVFICGIIALFWPYRPKVEYENTTYLYQAYKIYNPAIYKMKLSLNSMSIYSPITYYIQNNFSLNATIPNLQGFIDAYTIQPTSSIRVTVKYKLSLTQTQFEVLKFNCYNNSLQLKSSGKFSTTDDSNYIKCTRLGKSKRCTATSDKISTSVSYSCS